MNFLCISALLKRNRQKAWTYYFLVSTVVTAILLIALCVSNMGFEKTWNTLHEIWPTNKIADPQTVQLSASANASSPEESTFNEEQQ